MGEVRVNRGGMLMIAKRRIRSFSPMVGLAHLFVMGTGACAAEPSIAETAAIAQPLEAAPLPDNEEVSTKEAAPSDSTGLRAVMVRWGKSDADEVTSLTVIVENTGVSSKSADLVLKMRAPDGQVAEQAVRRMDLGPREEVHVTLAVADLPIQSSGVASTLEAIARYEQVYNAGAMLGETKPTPTVLATLNRAPVLYVTHSDDFSSAVVRSAEHEGRANGERFLTGSTPTLKEIRGTMARAVTQDQADEVPVQFVMRLPSGAGDLPPPSTLDADPVE
jgi:hypothetical protein